MAFYNVFRWDTKALMGQEDSPTPTQACQKMAGRLRGLYPGKSIAAITGKLYARKVGGQNFGGRPKIYG